MRSKITRFARGLLPINSTDIGFSFGGMCGNAESRQFRGVLLLRHISKLLQGEVVGATLVFSQNFCECIKVHLGISDSAWDGFDRDKGRYRNDVFSNSHGRRHMCHAP